MKTSDLVQGSEEWKIWRRKMITATDACIIMQNNPWVSPVELFQRKLGLIPEQPVNSAMLEGSRLEPIAREAFEKAVGMYFHPVVCVHDELEWCSASFDGLSETSAVEIKCPGKADHLTASMGLVPHKYKYQLAHQMFVADLEMMYYYSFDKQLYNLTGEAEGFIIEVKRNQEMIDRMLVEEKKFYECLIQKKWLYGD